MNIFFIYIFFLNVFSLSLHHSLSSLSLSFSLSHSFIFSLTQTHSLSHTFAYRGRGFLERVCPRGYDAILSSPYYLDHMRTAWSHYQVDPLPDNFKDERESEIELKNNNENTFTSSFFSEKKRFSRGNGFDNEARDHVLGGESCMWGEVRNGEERERERERERGKINILTTHTHSLNLYLSSLNFLSLSLSLSLLNHSNLLTFSTLSLSLTHTNKHSLTHSESLNL